MSESPFKDVPAEPVLLPPVGPAAVVPVDAEPPVVHLDPLIDSEVLKLLMLGVLVRTDNRFMLRVEMGARVTWTDLDGCLNEQDMRATVVEVTEFVWHRHRRVLMALNMVGPATTA